MTKPNLAKVSQKPAEYVLHLRTLPSDDGDEAGIRRLRRLLKNLVRNWGFRCVAIRPPMPEETEADNG